MVNIGNIDQDFDTVLKETVIGQLLKVGGNADNCERIGVINVNHQIYVLVERDGYINQFNITEDVKEN